MKFGTIVYHVANPDVPGVITSVSPDGTVASVVFQKPVEFSGNPQKGSATNWKCSTILLYLTAEEAKAKNRSEIRLIQASYKLLEVVKALGHTHCTMKMFAEDEFYQTIARDCLTPDVSDGFLNEIIEFIKSRSWD
jgi:hypothetical protein